MELFAEKLFVIPDKESVRTFEHDDSLPSLPVPSLQHTLERYLDSVKPFVTEEEFAQTKKIVSEFEQGIGKTLHEKLLRRAKRERNWVCTYLILILLIVEYGLVKNKE
jgi:Choline/Carnitine o-acyltransferase.